jgi:1,4-alpha-glucan branching enzyme
MNKLSVYFSDHIVLSTGVLALLLLVFFLASCQNKKPSKTSETVKEIPKHTNVHHLDWTKNANIYEVNIRQYTPEGTINAFIEHLPRLKNMGVDILWLMPVNPIGEKNRKGSLGSYYAVKDYVALNPEFGTIFDLKTLVANAHEMGMYVIIDWVANHTAWDNQLVTDHPEWSKKDEDGNLVSPFDWTDVLQLDYDNQELRAYMIDALKFWVEEVNIDGYRCDVAAMVPVDFWDDARAELDAIKPLFMLAESEEPELVVNAFDMDYGWEFHHIMNQVAKGEMNASDLTKYFSKPEKKYPHGAYRMFFTSNHDENSWNGTVNERLGDAVKTFAALSATVPAMPLIYSGQESGLDKRLRFFEKDTIQWDEDSEYYLFYQTLLSLKKRNKALWNGDFGGEMKILQTSDDTSVFAFIREKEDNKVVALFNLSPNDQEVTIIGKSHVGEYKEVFTKENSVINQTTTFNLDAWDFSVYENK